MKRLVKGMLVAALAVSASHVQAHTNKTFLMPRPHGVDIALENSSGWQELIHRQDKDKFGGNFQAIGFYRQSSSNDEIGNYFGVDGKRKFALKFKEEGGKVVEVADDVVSISPEQKSWGVYLTYYQELDKILKGLYFNINLPIVQVDNDMNVQVKDAALAKFLRGDVDHGHKIKFGGDDNAPLPQLQHARMGGRDTTTEVADIDIMLGYRFLDKESYHAKINIGITIPTGNEPDGRRLFEAVGGNGQHFGLGAGLDGTVRLWGDEEQNIKVHAAFNYRFLFESSERRTLGIKGVSAGHLQAVVFKVKESSFEDLQPAANALTQNVDVTPGSQFDGIINLAYNYDNFHIDAGYNLYFREDESVDLKDKVDPELRFAALKDAAGGGFVLNDARLLKDNIDTTAAENPSQTTHKVYGGIAYLFRNWDVPVLVGFGGHFEFRSNNSALETWGVNGRLGISF